MTRRSALLRMRTLHASASSATKDGENSIPGAAALEASECRTLKLQVACHVQVRARVLACEHCFHEQRVQQVQQREKEISVLVGMLRRREEAGGAVEQSKSDHPGMQFTCFADVLVASHSVRSGILCARGPGPDTAALSSVSWFALLDKDRAFELFKEGYAGTAAAVESADLLRACCMEARSAAQQVPFWSACIGMVFTFRGQHSLSGSPVPRLQPPRLPWQL